jgi:two-component system, chemotaxis family, response regulator Rcp1
MESQPALHFRVYRNPPARRRLKILLVEDSQADVWLFQEAFTALQIEHDLEIAPDGAQAIDQLKDGETLTPPDLILVDLNMPKVDGFQVLSFVRASPRLCVIPVIVLSSSRDPRDVRRAHELGANSYICKSTDDFVDLVGDFNRYWLARAEIPQPLVS